MKNMLPSYIPKNTTKEVKQHCTEGKSELSVEFSDLTDDQMMDSTSENGFYSV